MNSNPADQRRLLDLADVDSSLHQAEHARKNPPQARRVQELMARRQELSHELSALLGVRDDLRTELSRIESDVAMVDARSTRDAGRLATSSNSKEAQGLESEIAALARRKSDLEDAELEVMERLEQADAAVAAQEGAIAETNAEGATLSAEAKRVVAEATSRGEALRRDREAIVRSISDDLVALYDRLAARGVGAGLLTRGTCGGCNMMLSGTDMQRFRQTPADTVITCPECGCILVRTEESGL